jgi:soluble lytic murein transglycosylase-like protein
MKQTLTRQKQLTAVSVSLLLWLAFPQPSHANNTWDSRPKAGSKMQINRLYGLARSFREIGGEPDSVQWKVQWEEFQRLAQLVLGNHRLRYQDFQRAYVRGESVETANVPGARAKDDYLYAMSALGYSATEIADIIEGRITKAALDQAERMLMLGEGKARVSAFLESHYRGPRSRRAYPSASAIGPREFDQYVARYAHRHGVHPDLVRAVIQAESNWNPRALSQKGAIGLMQLMPFTAQDLGVNPHDPAQNIEGGVRYLAGLIHEFRSEKLALVAYNAGRRFAQKVRDGKAIPYGETRQYMEMIGKRYPLAGIF